MLDLEEFHTALAQLKYQREQHPHSELSLYNTRIVISGVEFLLLEVERLTKERDDARSKQRRTR